MCSRIEREDANGRAQDLTAFEAELSQLRTEQRRLAAAVASAPDVPELVAEMRKRGERIRIIEAQQAVAQRAPANSCAKCVRGGGESGRDGLAPVDGAEVKIETPATSEDCRF